jgi:hypothetical protein
MDDSRLIARFQPTVDHRSLIEKQLGQRRDELTDELYQTWREVEQCGLKETPEYRNVLLRADRHALWLAGLVRLSRPDAAPPLSSKEIEPIAMRDALMIGMRSCTCHDVPPLTRLSPLQCERDMDVPGLISACAWCNSHYTRTRPAVCWVKLLAQARLLTATPTVSHSAHRSCNNFTGSAGKICHPP